MSRDNNGATTYVNEPLPLQPRDLLVAKIELSELRGDVAHVPRRLVVHQTERHQTLKMPVQIAQKIGAVQNG